jgi:hypothetical protein
MTELHISDQWVLSRVSKDSTSFKRWMDGIFSTIEKSLENDPETQTAIQEAKKDLPDLVGVEQTILSAQQKIAQLNEKLPNLGALGGFISGLSSTITDAISSQLSGFQEDFSQKHGFNIDFLTGKRKTLSETLYDVAQERGIQSEGILYLIQSLPDFESFLYSTSAGKFYRDHTEHQLRVAVLGDFLLEQDFGQGTLLNHIADLTELDKSVLKEEIWWVLGLIHDIGYPLQKMALSINYSLLNQILKCYPMFDLEVVPFDIMLNHKKLTPYLEILEEGLSKEARKLIRVGSSSNLKQMPVPSVQSFHSSPEGHTEYHHQSQIDLDHGVIGGLALLKNLGTAEYIQDNKDELDGFIQAAQAIALHNFKGRLPDFIFQNHPLAFLLVLIDEMQEWGRPIPLQIKDSYFTTEMKKITLLDEVLLTIDESQWLMQYRKMDAKKLINFKFKTLCDAKNIALNRLQRDSDFPETRIVLQDYHIEKPSRNEKTDKKAEKALKNLKEQKKKGQKVDNKEINALKELVQASKKDKEPSRSQTEKLLSEYYIVV